MFLCVTIRLSVVQRENKVLRESVMRLEGENDNLAQELVASKVTLRQEMDRVSYHIHHYTLIL